MGWRTCLIGNLTDLGSNIKAKPQVLFLGILHSLLADEKVTSLDGEHQTQTARQRQTEADWSLDITRLHQTLIW